MNFLDKLRQKTERQKKMIALGVSIGVTLVILALWILAQMAMQ